MWTCYCDARLRRVVERNSFYKAAEDLAITPAALSKQIKQLENRLGTLLWCAPPAA